MLNSFKTSNSLLLRTAQARYAYTSAHVNDVSVNNYCDTRYACTVHNSSDNLPSHAPNNHPCPEVLYCRKAYYLNGEMCLHYWN